jgi:CheY-like chemotaxis protein
MCQKRVLITEDNRINQTVLEYDLLLLHDFEEIEAFRNSRQLRKSGCLTVLASNGVEAITAVQKMNRSGDHFDAILMGTPCCKAMFR